MFTLDVTLMAQLKSLAHGIKHMKQEDVEAAWDDDVLMGELMVSPDSCFRDCQPFIR